MRIMSVVGARPQFVKLAPIAHELARSSRLEHTIVHTGQHYDPALSDVFFRDLAIPVPNEHLGVGSGSHGVQTGRILAAMDDVLERRRPDCVLVYGDTNSTLAAALSAVKLDIPVAHLEAGLRSFNRRMPEEHNRVLVDHAADLLLAPTSTAVEHLAREGLAEQTVLVGDVMTDASFRMREKVLSEPAASLLPLAPPYVVATIHRAENTDDSRRLANVVDALRSIDTPILLVAHPRLRERANRFKVALRGASLTVVDALNYPQMVRTLINSNGVVTDSGGLQKEAFLLGVVCTTLRAETEWLETLEGGWNLLDPDLSRVRDCAARAKPTSEQTHPFGDGRAAERVVNEIWKFLCDRRVRAR